MKRREKAPLALVIRQGGCCVRPGRSSKTLTTGLYLNVQPLSLLIERGDAKRLSLCQIGRESSESPPLVDGISPSSGAGGQWIVRSSARSSRRARWWPLPDAVDE